VKSTFNDLIQLYKLYTLQEQSRREGETLARQVDREEGKKWKQEK